MSIYWFDGIEENIEGGRRSAECTYEFEAKSDADAIQKVLHLQGWNLRRIKEIPIESELPGKLGNLPDPIERIVRFRSTLREVTKRLLEKFPNAKPVRDATNDVNHTLWMIHQIRNNPKRLDTQRKVIAWYNWIMAKAHTLKLFDVGDPEITEIRNLARADAALLHKASK